MKLVFIFIATLFILDSSLAWKTHGRDNHNTRYDGRNLFLDSNSAPNIGLAWNASIAGYVAGSPSIDESLNLMFFCDFKPNGGFLYAYHTTGTRALAWKRNISNDSGIAGDYCRATPTILGNWIFVGSQASGNVYKYNRLNGSYLGNVLINPHPFAIVTMSISAHGHSLYVGASSKEELAAANPNYSCCSFIGSFSRVNAILMIVDWTYHAIPPHYIQGPTGVSGVGFWGNTPVIDTENGQVITATGNPYQVYQEWENCIIANATNSSCIPEDILFNAVISFDMITGAVIWSERLSIFDNWNVACLLPPPYNANCPTPAGDDADFGMSPTLVKNSTCDNVLLIAQKNGLVWSLDLITGKPSSGLIAAPVGSLGGFSWGGASDGSHYYISAVNNYHTEWPLSFPVNTTTRAGFFVKVDINTLENECQVAIPGYLANETSATSAIGSPVIINDLWIVTSTNPTGNQLHILNKNTCQVILSLSVGQTPIYGGVSVSGKCIYVGSGYNSLFNALWNEGTHQIFAFCLP